jgi:hypothetical protein
VSTLAPAELCRRDDPIGNELRDLMYSTDRRAGEPKTSGPYGHTCAVLMRIDVQEAATEYIIGHWLGALPQPRW